VPGVWLLLCTDGLTNEVGQDQIVSLMETSDEIGGAADALVELALANGGHENIGVAVAELCD
jgi:PPM family protein phosphatase